MTSLLIKDQEILLTSALAVAEHQLMGEFASRWPLTKVLDIGGRERCPKYTSKVDTQVSSEWLVGLGGIQEPQKDSGGEGRER